MELSVKGNTSNPVTAIHQLVGDGKKFKDVESLAKGKLESDSFIIRLQEEIHELKNQLNERNTMEDILAQIKEQNKPQQIAVNTNDEVELTPNQPTAPNLEDLVAKAIIEREGQMVKEQNIRKTNEVLSTMSEGNVEKAKQILSEAALRHGLSVEYLIDVGKTSPQAFTSLVSKPTQDTHSITPTLNSLSSVNTQYSSNSNSFDNTPEGKRLAELKSLIKTDKRRFLSSEVQIELNQLQMKQMDFLKG